MDSPLRATPSSDDALPSPNNDGAANMTDRSVLDDHTLLVAAESRIDTAIAQLMLTTHGVANATISHSITLSELREVRDIIRVVRDRIRR